jgi:hypothetical protein
MRKGKREMANNHQELIDESLPRKRLAQWVCDEDLFAAARAWKPRGLESTLAKANADSRASQESSPQEERDLLASAIGERQGRRAESEKPKQVAKNGNRFLGL